MNATALAQVHDANATNGPEYDGPEGTAKRFGFGRSLCFELIRQGKIKSISLKTRAGNVRGRRLVNIQSVRDYLNTLTTTN